MIRMLLYDTNRNVFHHLHDECYKLAEVSHPTEMSYEIPTDEFARIVIDNPKYTLMYKQQHNLIVAVTPSSDIDALELDKQDDGHTRFTVNSKPYTSNNTCCAFILNLSYHIQSFILLKTDFF